jgi:hypothetical protein
MRFTVDVNDFDCDYIELEFDDKSQGVNVATARGRTTLSTTEFRDFRKAVEHVWTEVEQNG